MSVVVDMLECHASQVFEFLPFNQRIADQVPADRADRRRWLHAWYAAIIRPRARPVSRGPGAAVRSATRWSGPVGGGLRNQRVRGAARRLCPPATVLVPDLIAAETSRSGLLDQRSRWRCLLAVGGLSAGQPPTRRDHPRPDYASTRGLVAGVLPNLVFLLSDCTLPWPHATIGTLQSSGFLHSSFHTRRSPPCSCVH